MTRIVKQGEELLEEVRTTVTEAGQVAFWWLGQNSFIIKGGRITIYIDPYLSPSAERLIGAPIKPEQATNADIVCCSHDHGDHIDPGTIPTLAQASPNAKFVAPRTARQRMVDLGVMENRLILLSDGESSQIGDVRIEAVKAKHEKFDEVPGVGFPYLSYVITLNNLTLWHAGDGIYYEGLISTLQRFHFGIDLMFVPINGRDGRRFRANCMGNFTFQEAGDIAAAIKPKLVVPMHYDMFADNTERVENFTEYISAKWPWLRCHVCQIGERVKCGGG